MEKELIKDKRVPEVNGWAYMDEFFQFFYPINIKETFSFIDEKKNHQVLSVAGVTGRISGEAAWFKDCNHPFPKKIVLESAKSISHSDSIKKIVLYLTLQSKDWCIKYLQENKIQIPLNGDSTRIEWDVEEDFDKLGTGILRYWFSIRVETNNPTYVFSLIAFSRLKFIYPNGSEEIVDFNFTGVGVENEPTTPDKFELSQNFPNPFNPTTSIKFSVPQTQYVSLKVYDVLGTEVATLVDEEKFAGNYNVQFNGSSLASGVYLYRLQAGNFVQTKKLILMK